jgi:hypothetical protein
VKPKEKETPIRDENRLLGTGTVGSGGGKIKLMHKKDCVIGARASGTNFSPCVVSICCTSIAIGITPSQT